MAAPVLNDYEYQFGDAGVLLNGSNATLPFIDVERVTGLDMAEVDVSEHDVDGTHGGTVYGAYFKVRTVVIEATVYAQNTNVDSYINTLITNYLPTASPVPFYFKGAGTPVQFLFCYSMGIRFDVDRLRSTGTTKIQIQLKAADPIKYTETVTALTNTTYTNANNVGNMPTYPIYKVTGGTYNLINFHNSSQNKLVEISRQNIASDILVVDFNTRMVYLNGNRNSSLLGSSVVDWWDVKPGTNNIRYNAFGTSGFVVPTVTVTWRSGWA